MCPGSKERNGRHIKRNEEEITSEENQIPLPREVLYGFSGLVYRFWEGQGIGDDLKLSRLCNG